MATLAPNFGDLCKRTLTLTPINYSSEPSQAEGKRPKWGELRGVRCEGKYSATDLDESEILNIIEAERRKRSERSFEDELRAGIKKTVTNPWPHLAPNYISDKTKRDEPSHSRSRERAKPANFEECDVKKIFGDGLGRVRNS